MERITLDMGPLDSNHGPRVEWRVNKWSSVLQLVHPYIDGARIIGWFEQNEDKTIGKSAIDALYGWQLFRISKLGRILREEPVAAAIVEGSLEFDA
jgi:hypothetical protein